RSPSRETVRPAHLPSAPPRRALTSQPSLRAETTSSLYRGPHAAELGCERTVRALMGVLPGSVTKNCEIRTEPVRVGATRRVEVGEHAVHHAVLRIEGEETRLVDRTDRVAEARALRPQWRGERRPGDGVPRDEVLEGRLIGCVHDAGRGECSEQQTDQSDQQP